MKTHAESGKGLHLIRKVDANWYYDSPLRTDTQNSLRILYGAIFEAPNAFQPKPMWLADALNLVVE